MSVWYKFSLLCWYKNLFSPEILQNIESLGLFKDKIRNWIPNIINEMPVLVECYLQHVLSQRLCNRDFRTYVFHFIYVFSIFICHSQGMLFEYINYVYTKKELPRLNQSIAWFSKKLLYYKQNKREYIYIYIYINFLCQVLMSKYIYKKLRHLFTKKLYFGFFQTFKDSIK